LAGCHFGHLQNKSIGPRRKTKQLNCEIGETFCLVDDLTKNILSTPVIDQSRAAGAIAMINETRAAMRVITIFIKIAGITSEIKQDYSSHSNIAQYYLCNFKGSSGRQSIQYYR